MSIENDVEGESGNKVKEHPATLEVTYGDLLVVSNLLESFLVLVFTNKIKEKIQHKKCRYQMVNIYKCL